jgi:hypothetical protein
MGNKPKFKIKESDIAQICVEYFSYLNYDVYKEVTMNGKGGRRSDIYAMNDDISIIVEVKLNFSLKVIEQAYSWRNNANKAYICVPKPKHSDRKSHMFGKRVCEELGIGVIVIDFFNAACVIDVESIFHENIKKPVLYESQKNSVAGNNESKYHSAFKETCLNIDNYMKDINEPIKLSEIIKNITHHYRTETSASYSIKKMIEQSVITGYIYDKGYITKIL